jgi:hypothetical protein
MSNDGIWTEVADNKDGATLTAYTVRNRLNELLRAVGAKDKDGEPKVLAGPQVYQYAKAGRIDGLRSEAMTARRFTETDCDNFVVGYVIKNFPDEWAAFQNKVDAEAPVDLDEVFEAADADVENEKLEDVDA